LDIAAKVEATARDEREKAHEKVRAGNGDWIRLESAAAIWGISIILLGSGSERLDKDSKRLLARRIVQLTSIILDQVLRMFPKVEFAALKEGLLSKDKIRAHFMVENDQDIESTTEFIRTVIEAYEFQIVGFPIRLFLDYLGNSAGQSVLRPSVASVQSDHIIENLVARIWAAEIDATRERTPLLEAIHDLPPHAFLRTTISSFFLTRVFWNQWDRNNRLVLLDAAAECLSPLSGPQVDKGRLKRIIDKDEDGDISPVTADNRGPLPN
jgi:hypothetical protein